MVVYWIHIKRPPKLDRRNAGSSGDGRDDGQLIGVTYYGVLPIEVPDIVIAKVDADEGTKIAVSVKQMLSERWKTVGQVLENVRHR